MYPWDVESLCRKHMREHGLIELGWRFAWSNGKRVFGLCRHSTKTILISRNYALRNKQAQVEDTILHEIAHALVGPAHGHDAVWKAKCREIGAKPERLACDAVSAPHSLELRCPACESVLQRRHRKVNPKRLRTLYCIDCGPKTLGGLIEVKV